MKIELWVAIITGGGAALIAGIIEKLLTPYINRNADKNADARLEMDREQMFHRFDAEMRAELKTERDSERTGRIAAEEKTRAEIRRADDAEGKLRIMRGRCRGDCEISPVPPMPPETPLLQITDKAGNPVSIEPTA